MPGWFSKRKQAFSIVRTGASGLSEAGDIAPQHHNALTSRQAAHLPAVLPAAVALRPESARDTPTSENRTRDVEPSERAQP